MSYPGGKGSTYHNLINLMPPHEVYIETHLGGGAVMLNKRPANRNIGVEIDHEVLEMWSAGNQIDFEMIQDDAVNYLKNYRFIGKELVYCDPPYLRETRKKRNRLYKYEYSRKQHVDLLEVLKSLKCKVMISGYESTLYMESLKDWNTHSYQASCQHGVATEWMWMNYSSPEDLHDYRYLGANFRERERIRNKSRRWTSKLESMPVLERQALFASMDAVRDRHASPRRLGIE